MSEARRFWDEQADFSELTFGSSKDRGPLGALKHLEKEAKEAQAELEMIEIFTKRMQEVNDLDPRVAESLTSKKHLHEEIVDCLFLTYDAARRSGMTFDDLYEGAFRKLEKNRKRKWQVPTSPDQPIEHVRGEHD